MKFNIENYKNNEKMIKFNVNNIEINVNGCDEKQIEMLIKNKITYCEKPKCKESCPINTTAICIKSNETLNNINDINKNICECITGYTGHDCSEKIMINYG